MLHLTHRLQACDKIRFLSLTDQTLLGEGEQANLEIRVRLLLLRRRKQGDPVDRRVLR